MPKIINRAEYRQEMLEKCFYFLGRKGYSNITMHDIASELGISAGALYHYFPSKGDMLWNMIAWAGMKNVDHLISRIGSVDNVRDNFDMAADVMKDSGEFYQNIMLLAIDMYRNMDVEQVTEYYDLFSGRFIDLISEKLDISRQFANFIFICVVGIIFNSLAVGKLSEFNKQIDFLGIIFRPQIVDAPEDMERAAQKFKEITSTFLMNKFVSEKTTAAKNEIKKDKIKKVKTKRIN